MTEEPRCLHCINYEGHLKCPAFPEGIPHNILLDIVSHDSLIEGQEGELVFERKNEIQNT